jgi:hypothetical protein
VEAPCRRSKRMKKSAVENSVMVSSLHDGPLLAADLGPSEWEIMYPLFVEFGLVDPSEREDN